MTQELHSQVRIYRDCFNTELGADLIQEVEQLGFIPQQLYKPEAKALVASGQYECIQQPTLASSLTNSVNQAVSRYITELNCPGFKTIDPTYVRFLRYDVTGFMDKHWDRVTAYSNDYDNGVPTLSAIGYLNNEFTGGELIMFDNTVIDLNVGDIVVFPSTHLYPHRISPVLTGTRYSFAIWWHGNNQE